jgi:hypothetical protein
MIIFAFLCGISTLAILIGTQLGWAIGLVSAAGMLCIMYGLWLMYSVIHSNQQRIFDAIKNK